MYACMMYVFMHACVCAGYVGSAKGAKQMLWERGHWRAGLTLACCRKILKDMPDFRLETSELSNLWRERGHGFELGVKCHPEMAGCGIEYCWGKVCVFLLVACHLLSAHTYVLVYRVCTHTHRENMNSVISSIPRRLKGNVTPQMS